MKSLILILCIASLSVSATDLTTKSGKVYKDYEILTVTDKNIKISHEGGIAEVSIPDLPEEVKSSIQGKIDAYKPSEKVIGTADPVKGATPINPATIKPKFVPDNVFPNSSSAKNSRGNQRNPK